MAHFLHSVKQIVQDVIFVFLGIFFWLCIALYLVVSWPLFLYRWIITKCVAPCFRKSVGKAVNVNGNAIAAEFLKPVKSTRCSIVVNLFFDGDISYEEFYNVIETNWVRAQDNSGKLKYPEFQQYLERWMGFMFWKPDKEFQLKNHIKLHSIDDDVVSCDYEFSERFLCHLNEKLLNEPFPSKRSPWEMHLTRNYRNSRLLAEKGYSSENCSRKLTIWTLRIHHGMADGFAILHLLVEQLLGHSLESVARPHEVPKNSNPFLNAMSNKLTFPVKTCHELGHVIALGSKKRTPFHCPDRRKMWHQLYGRAPLIPLTKIKLIKNVFGTSFAAVVNSVLAAAMAKILKKLLANEKNPKSVLIPRNLLFGNAFPTMNHPKKIRNHALGVMFDVPLRPDMEPLERLLECERNVQQVKRSSMPMLSGLALKFLSGTLAPLARYLIRNRTLATGVSSFPGPGVHLAWRGRKALAVDYAAGALCGVAGVGFMTLSYADKIQFCVTAEAAVLSREDVEQVWRHVEDELDSLYGLAMSSVQKKAVIVRSDNEVV